jgi:iron(III) transport system ATP-binding protein
LVDIAIRSLDVAYGPAKVIDDLSLTIPSGGFFTLLGPSGCGKTTLLRTLAGFIPAAGGQISFGDRDVTRLPAHLRDIGMVFQDYALFPDKTVFENVAYGLRARSLDQKTINARVGEHLEKVGLSAFPERRPAELSGGQRQRVALARALAISPTVLLMDEPLSNLDAKLRVQVRETIADLQREVGITTIFVTHDQEEALALSDRIGLMRLGKLEQVGTPEEIYARPVSAYVADFVGAANTVPVEIIGAVAANGTAEVLVGGETLTVLAPAALPVGKAMLIARGETLRIAPVEEPAHNTLSAIIRRRQYLGGRTSYHVATANDVVFHVEAHEIGAPAHAVGQSVKLVFDPALTLVVAG